MSDATRAMSHREDGVSHSETSTEPNRNVAISWLLFPSQEPQPRRRPGPLRPRPASSR